MLLVLVDWCLLRVERSGNESSDVSYTTEVRFLRSRQGVNDYALAGCAPGWEGRTRPMLDDSHSLRLAVRSPVLRSVAAVAAAPLLVGAVGFADLLVAGVVVEEAAAAADDGGGGGVDAAAGACRFMNLSPRVPLLSPIFSVFGSDARR